jgi:hypothetical protein
MPPIEQNALGAAQGLVIDRPVWNDRGNEFAYKSGLFLEGRGDRARLRSKAPA